MEQTYALYAKNGNSLWADTTYKEMENVRVSFEILPDGKSVPIGHQIGKCHMIFNIKMEDFRQKARLVLGGIATRNDLEVKLGDILNAYVQTPVTEKV